MNKKKRSLHTWVRGRKLTWNLKNLILGKEKNIFQTMKCWVPRWFSGGGCIPMCKQQTTKSSIHTMSKGQFEAIPSTPGKRGLEAFGRLSDWWRFLTQHFRYLKWRYTEPYKAILRVGFPLHKPYPYSLYRWVVSTFILGTCNVWWFAPPIFQSFESDRITPKKVNWRLKTPTCKNTPLARKKEKHGETLRTNQPFSLRLQNVRFRVQ